MRLENRIVMYGYRSDETEIDKAVEGVCLRKRAKNGAWLFTVLAAVLSSVICGTYFGIYGVNTPWSLMVWAIIGLCGIAGAVITWWICWPFVGRSKYWQDAVNFVGAIRYAERVTGKPFENWSALDDDVEKAVEEALRLELSAIVRMMDGLNLELSTVEGFFNSSYGKPLTLLNHWKERRLQVSRLFPSIPEEKVFFVRCGTAATSSEMGIDG